MVIFIEFGILVCYFRISIYPCNFVFKVIETGMSLLCLLRICYCFQFLFNFLLIKTKIVSQLLLYLHEFLYVRVFSSLIRSMLSLNFSMTFVRNVILGLDSKCLNRSYIAVIA